MRKTKRIAKIAIAVVVVAVLMAATCFAEDAVSSNQTGLTNLVSNAMDWCASNPETVLAAVVTGAAGGVNMAGGVSNKKTRKKMTLDSGSLAASAAKINDNAIELAEKVKKSVESLVSSVQIVVQNAVTEIGKKMDELIETVKTNTAETRKMRKELKANSWLLGELVKDSRLTTMRKDEIITGYKKMIENEEEEENEKHDET